MYDLFDPQHTSPFGPSPVATPEALRAVRERLNSNNWTGLFPPTPNASTAQPNPPLGGLPSPLSMVTSAELPLSPPTDESIVQPDELSSGLLGPLPMGPAGQFNLPLWSSGLPGALSPGGRTPEQRRLYREQRNARFQERAGTLGNAIWNTLTAGPRLMDDLYNGRTTADEAVGSGRVLEAAMLPVTGMIAAPRAVLGSGLTRPTLPMDEASRLARAEALGFRTDMPLAHGTATEIRAFDPAQFGASTGTPTSKHGVWSEVRTGPETPMADYFAELAARKGGVPQVMPMRYRADKGRTFNLKGTESFKDVEATILQAYRDGYDALKFTNWPFAGSTSMLVKNPAQLRSPFAQFDPARRNSNDLVAGLAGLGLLGGIPVGSNYPLPPEQPPR